MPVVTPLGDGYAIYVESGGMYENDVWTVCLSEGGRVLHFGSDQIKVWHNETFGIKKKDEKTEEV